MKKKVFGSIAVLAIAAMAAFNVNIKTQENGLSDVSLANVEALASESLPNGCSGSWDKVCCVCGNTHYTYAKSNGGSCTTKSGCSHY